MQSQDWNNVIINKTTKINNNNNTNKKIVVSDDSKRFKSFDEATDARKIELCSLSFGQQIQRARLEKNMTQKQLATAVNVKPVIITQYECGKGQPSEKIKRNIEKVLGCQLKK